MNNLDYEQKKDECWRSVNNNTRDFGIITLRCFTAIFDCAYALGKKKEAITQEEIEKAALEYIFNRQKARHNAKRDEEASLSDFDNTLKAWDAFDMAQAYEDGANYALGKQEKDAEETVIQGWVARDKGRFLGLYPWQPKRGDAAWLCGSCMVLPINTFPDLTWDDDPIEVELIIKRKKK